MTPDYYALLGVPPKATPRDIQVAYRKGVLACHPDRDPSPEALARSQKLGEAYAVLRDPQKRHKYDLEQCYERGFPKPKETPHYHATGSVRVDIDLEAKIREFMRFSRDGRANGHLGSCTCKDCRPEMHGYASHEPGGYSAFCNCDGCRRRRDNVVRTETRAAAQRNAFEFMRQAVQDGILSPQEFARQMEKTEDDEGSGL